MADEQLLMGSSSYGVGLGDWVVTAPEHWLFAGTGMKAGDRVPGLSAGSITGRRSRTTRRWSSWRPPRCSP